MSVSKRQETTMWRRDDNNSPRGIGIKSRFFEAFINRWEILKGRPCRVRVRHRDGEEKKSKVTISVRQVMRGLGCEKRNELQARGA